jgi:hypothetical protein
MSHIDAVLTRARSVRADESGAPAVDGAPDWLDLTPADEPSSGWSSVPSRPTVNGERMFDALDRALAQAPLSSPRRVVPPRREAAE